jgi:UDPglucose 6-dehydrogenase
MREAPSLSIIDNLLKTKVNINVIDPKGKHFGKEMLNGVKWFDDPYEAVESSDLVLILTDWKEFADLDLKRLSSSMQTPQMLDGRNLFSPAQALSNGFTKYFGNGRN